MLAEVRAEEKKDRRKQNLEAVIERIKRALQGAGLTPTREETDVDSDTAATIVGTKGSELTLLASVPAAHKIA